MSAPVEVREHLLETLRFIALYIEQHGYSPSLREIGVRFAVKSSNASWERIDGLIKLGLIRRTPKVARSIIITEAGRQCLAR